MGDFRGAAGLVELADLSFTTHPSPRSVVAMCYKALDIESVGYSRTLHEGECHGEYHVSFEQTRRCHSGRA